jgi:hypothetical protein
LEEQEITPEFAEASPAEEETGVAPDDVVLVEEAKEEENVLVITDKGDELETTSTSPTTLPPHEELAPNKFHLFERLLAFLDT